MVYSYDLLFYSFIFLSITPYLNLNELKLKKSRKKCTFRTLCSSIMIAIMIYKLDLVITIRDHASSEDIEI